MPNNRIPIDKYTKFNVPLTDPRIVEAGLDPNSFLGVGLSESELQRRVSDKKGKK